MRFEKRWRVINVGMRRKALPDGCSHGEEDDLKPAAAGLSAGVRGKAEE